MTAIATTPSPTLAQPTAAATTCWVRLLAPLLLLAAAFLTGCGGGKPMASYGHAEGPYPIIPPPKPPPYVWNGDGVTGKPRIVINLSEQKAYFYRSGEVVGESDISTGREGYDTPTGNFKVIQKDQDHRSNLYGTYIDAAGNPVVKNVDVMKDKKPPGTTFLGASMPYFLRVTGGVGMHEGYLPGYAASHGCIRMPEGAAVKFFENAPMGTPVTITQ